jgi:DNA polymerase-3 subunit epsilon
MDFIAIDFETANPNFASICQVGIAIFNNGKLHDTWESLVDPEDYFDDLNVSIHGIDEMAVLGAPTWEAVYKQLTPKLQGNIVVSHTVFDRVALSRACEKSGITAYNYAWLDSARVVRRTWPAFAQSGYGLADMTNYLNIKFRHHNALEDARATGEILLMAMAETGLTVEQWIDRTAKPIDLLSATPITRHGNPDGVLFGENLVFTGALSMPRKQAADLAASAGCEVTSGVNKHTTVLIVGDQDISKLAGHEKSIKHRKAENLMALGQNIRIIGESDFQRLMTST